jgi:hypothetical protein
MLRELDFNAFCGGRAHLAYVPELQQGNEILRGNYALLYSIDFDEERALQPFCTFL